MLCFFAGRHSAREPVVAGAIDGFGLIASQNTLPRFGALHEGVGALA
jgi:hypothetical protein